MVDVEAQLRLIWLSQAFVAVFGAVLFVANLLLKEDAWIE